MLLPMPTVLLLCFTLLTLACQPALAQPPAPTDARAEKMLRFQRSNGGWPQYNGDPTDYSQPLDDKQLARLLADYRRTDATIDDGSTTKEISYLLEAYASTQNTAYLTAAERGIAYLLEAQNPAGGWPQFYPDSSRYRIHITFNDNAMIDVLWIMRRLALGEPPYGVVDTDLRRQARTAMERGIECILATQVKQDGQLTAWCAQHDSQTLAPAPARAFEPASLSGMESVGIVEFLLAIEAPSAAVRTAITAAVAWFERVELNDLAIETITTGQQPPGRDRVVVSRPGSTLWARFYELGTNRPIFTGRDGIVRYELSAIEHERRMGYVFYGQWPRRLLQEAFPAWQKRHSD